MKVYLVIWNVDIEESVDCGVFESKDDAELYIQLMEEGKSAYQIEELDYYASGEIPNE